MGIITGGNGNVCNVSSANQLFVINPSTITASGNPNNPGNYVTQVCEADAGTVTGAPTQRQCDISGYYRQRVGVDTLLFSDRFSGTPPTGLTTVPSTSIWLTSMNMASTYGSGVFTMNSGNSTTINQYCILQSLRTFQYIYGYTLQMETQLIINGNSAQTNAVVEIGFGLVATNATPTDGVYFRYASDGTFDTIINYNGTETVQSATLPLPSVNVVHNYIIVMNNYNVEFWVDNILYSNLAIPTLTAGSATINNCLPMFIRQYNSGSSPSTSISVKVAGCSMTLGDMNSGKPWNNIMAGLGNNISQFPSGATTASPASIVLYSNSLAPGAGAAGSNTTANLGSGLGGQFAWIPSSAVSTDIILSSFQVPAMATAVIARNLYITGFSLQSAVTTVLVGGPFILAYSIAYGSTAVSLATTESVTTKAPRRIPLAYETYVSAAAVGTVGQGITRQFQTPIFVQPGEFIQTVVKNIGTLGSSGVICYNIMFEGYWE
jgi:hypothetical protein